MSIMGLRPSPYNATQGMAEAEDVIRGDKMNAANPYRWDRVSLNIPGQMNYDPKLPWVAKVRLDGQIAAGDIFIYIDDLRPVNDAEGSCWMHVRVLHEKGDPHHRRVEPGQTRAKVRWIRDALDRKEGVDRKELEHIRGIHLLLESWRDNRNDEGWKLTLAEMRAVDLVSGSLISLCNRKDLHMSRVCPNSGHRKA
eukprot:scaffold410750_cov28-Attheya_sp.AAC.1